jgi:putative ABC transport system permease protein
LTIQHRDYLEAPALDLYVAEAEKLASQLVAREDVSFAKRLINGQGMGRSGAEATGVGVMGLEPSIERHLSPIADHIVEGEYLRDEDERWVLIGVDMASRLELAPGKKLVISANDIHGDLVESLFRVRGVFRSGEPGLDGYVVQMPIGAAARFYGLPEGAATDLGIVLRHRTDRERVSRAANERIADHPDLVLRGWEEVQPGLASYVRTDRGSLLIMAGILIALTLFTIFNTLLMSVLERRREFAVQMAIGVSARELGLQIVVEAGTLAILGCALGSVIGLGANLALGQSGINMLALMGSDEVSLGNFAVSPIVYPDLSLASYVRVIACVFGATLLTGVLPMRLIRRMQLAHELRA